MLSIDIDILYFFNVMLYAPWLDGVASFVTNLRNWVPVYALIAAYLGIRYRWRGVRMLIACVILIGCADLIANRVIKELVARPRPCSLINDPSGLYSWIRSPDGIRLGYGFPSAHAVNNFAGVVFFILLFRNNRKLLWLFVPAVIPPLSRVYLGLHYPSDILGGMIIGTALGWIFAYLYNVMEKKYFSRPLEQA